MLFMLNVRVNFIINIKSIIKYFFRGRTHRWVVMIALNTEPVQNNQFHIGEIQFYSLSRHTIQTFLTLM